MTDILPGEVSQWRRRGAKVSGVREPQKSRGGHLPGAIHVPLASLTLTADLCASPVVVCASGGRSARAAALLTEAGHLEVANLLGGTFGWGREHRPVEFPEVDGDDRP